VLQQKGHELRSGNPRRSHSFRNGAGHGATIDHVVTIAFVSQVLSASRPITIVRAGCQLLGIAEALRDQVTSMGSASDVDDYERLLASARNTVDAQVYAVQISEGRAMPRADAVDLMLRIFAEYD
jgi:hypothetical protein